jgi:hypothetical protein
MKDRGGLHRGFTLPTISSNQKKILDYILLNKYSIKRIARIEDKSRQAIYKTVNKLIKKGFLIRGLNNELKNRGVDKTGGGLQTTKELRLHNVQININIIKTSKKYLNIYKKSNKMSFSNCTLMLYEDKIIVYTKEGLSFWGDTSDEAYKQAIRFFETLYLKIENRLYIIIDKDQYINKKWVRQHIAKTNDEAAKKSNEAKDPIVILDKDDGKQAIITDNSFNLNELEAIHPKNAKLHIDRYKNHIDDIINNNPLNNSQITSRINDLIELAAIERDNNKEINQTLKQLIELILKK